MAIRYDDPNLLRNAAAYQQYQNNINRVLNEATPSESGYGYAQKLVRTSMPPKKEKVNMAAMSDKIRRQDIKDYTSEQKLRKQEMQQTREGRVRLEAERLAKKRELDAVFKRSQFAQDKGRVAKVTKGIAKGIAGVFGGFGGMGGGYSQPSGGTGRGRGRPVGSLTPKYLPGVGYVTMPIYEYRKAFRRAIAQQRLQQQMAQAKAAMMPSPQEMPQTYQPYDSEEAFLNQPDMNQMQQQMPQQMPMQQPMQMQQKPGFFQRLSNVGNMFGGQRQMQPGMQQAPPMSAGTYPTNRIHMWGQGVGLQPQKNILSTSGSILNTPNAFNRRGDFRVI